MTSDPRIVTRSEIDEALGDLDPLALIEEGFALYSAGKVVVGPVGELLFRSPPGELHLKYGYIEDGPYYVVKLASGFYDNPSHGLPSNDGMMLVFDRATGAPVAVLLDHGGLTDVRTAVAGAVAAKHLAPDPVEEIGVLGAGVQARLQLEWLGRVLDCRRARLWARRQEAAEACAADMRDLGFEVTVAGDPSEVGESCRLVVTTTAATEPLLPVDAVRPGTHITAMGSDTADKRELDPAILGRADRVVADSRLQCRERGEISWALREGLIDAADVVELGEVISGNVPGRRAAEDITVADLTGVAVQDIQIATAVWRRIEGAR